MEISPIFFYLFSGLAIFCSLMVVFKKNPVTSAFNLVLVFFAFASIYALMGAHFVAALQVLVYAGAIMVLFVFVIMLLKADEPVFDLRENNKFFVMSVALTLLGIAGYFITTFKEASYQEIGPYSISAIEQNGGNTRVLAETLFSQYILPFELTSILLLGAIVAVVAIAMRKKNLKSNTNVGGKA